jgi:hypothetical protein
LKIRELLHLLLWPLTGLCLFFSLQMFAAYYTQGMSSALDYVMNLIDLREERTFGTWFQSLLFVLTGLSFFMVSRHPALPRFGKTVLILMSLGFCFLSADEALSLHEFMGYHLEQITGIVQDTAMEQRGYSWVLLYAPAAVAVFAMIFCIYRPVLNTSPDPAVRRLFALAWISVAVVMVFEMAEGLAFLARTDQLSVLPCIEETFELAALMLFYSANLRIAEKAEL